MLRRGLEEHDSHLRTRFFSSHRGFLGTLVEVLCRRPNRAGASRMGLAADHRSIGGDGLLALARVWSVSPADAVTAARPPPLPGEDRITDSTKRTAELRMRERGRVACKYRRERALAYIHGL